MARISVRWVKDADSGALTARMRTRDGKTFDCAVGEERRSTRKLSARLLDRLVKEGYTRTAVRFDYE